MRKPEGDEEVNHVAIQARVSSQREQLGQRPKGDTPSLFYEQHGGQCVWDKVSWGKVKGDKVGEGQIL